MVSKEYDLAYYEDLDDDDSCHKDYKYIYWMESRDKMMPKNPQDID